MRPEVAPVSKGSLAVLTAEGLLSRMRSDVPLKQPRPGERLPAEMALAG